MTRNPTTASSVRATFASPKRDKFEAAAPRRQPLAEMKTAIADCLDAFQCLESALAFDEADALLEEGMQAYPGVAPLRVQYVLAAYFRRDLHSAAERAEEMRNIFPDHRVGYTVGLRALFELDRIDDADIVQEVAAGLFHDEFWPHVVAAKIADQRGRFKEADALWQSVGRDFASEPKVWAERATRYLKSGRLEAANQVLSEAVQRFPDDPQVGSDHADIAEWLKDWPEADRRWTRLVQRFPDNTEIARRFALTSAQSRSETQRDWALAMARLDDCEKRFPEVPDFPLARVRLLRRKQELDAAEAMGQAEIDRAGGPVARPDLIIELAEIREERGDANSAISTLEAQRAAFRTNVRFQITLGNMLSRARRYDDADHVFRQALDLFRTHDELQIAYATSAMHRGDWNAAFERWQEAAYRFPSSQDVRVGLATTRLFLNGADEEAAPVSATGGTQSPLATFMSQFLSLGATPNTVGCEFGFVQRRYGSEPIDLLRWADISYEKLLEGFETRFEGVGTSEQTEIYLSKPTADYFTRDKRFGMDMHTFIYKNDMEPEALFAQSCRRLAFLRRKLIDDLTSAKRIFVYSDGNADLGETEIVKIHDAMKRFGDAKLLLVTRSVGSSKARAVRLLRAGLALAELPVVKRSEPGENLRQETTAWVRICWEALRLLSPGAEAAYGDDLGLEVSEIE